MIIPTVPTGVKALVAVVLTAGLGMSFDVQARPDRRQAARAHFSRGQLHYREQEYHAALEEFEAGYAALPLPGFLVNIAQCQRHLSDFSAARASYERFLELAPDSPLALEVKTLVRDLTVTPPPFTAAPVESGANRDASSSTPDASRLALAPLSETRRHPPSGADLGDAPETIASHPEGASRDTRSGRRWSLWLWGGFAFATLAVSAAMIASASGGTATIHDGTLGTLRR